MTEASTSRRKLQLNEQQWRELRQQLIQKVPVDDGQYQYTLFCETPAELWRARTLKTKEQGTVDWIQREIRAGDVVYDIGANIGLYTLLAARRVGEAGKVYAFEPHVANVNSLLRNVSGNRLSDRVKIISSALNDRPGFFDFHYYHGDAGSSMSQLDGKRAADESVFEPAYSELKFATTIDHLVSEGAIRPADHVKIDVDGNEMLVLRGMTRLLTSERGIKTLQVEVNDRFRGELFDFLRECGYEMHSRHHTAHGKQAIAAGYSPESIAYNAIFTRAAGEQRRMHLAAG